MYSTFNKELISSKDNYGRDESLRKPISNNIQENLSMKDEFGRDIELRKAFVAKQTIATTNDIATADDIKKYIDDIAAKLKVMSWADFTYEEEEAEEENSHTIEKYIAQLKEERLKNCYQRLGNIRSNLITMDSYVLEEGEVLY